MELNFLKQQISEWINVSQCRIHEISLEDVVISEDVLYSIDEILSQLTVNYNTSDDFRESIFSLDQKVPCYGYWIENTKDLVIYISYDHQSRTIIIPQDDWMIRNDITIN